MRNGNEATAKSAKDLGVGSYRTYEEWKLNNGIPVQSPRISSYRTYEEWKHPFFTSYNLSNISSYRTYEEWKRYSR